MRTPVSPQLRFLLRGSGLLIATLTFWWWVVLPPSLEVYRIATGLLLHLAPGDGSTASAELGSNGDWLLRVPISASLAKQDAVQRTFGRAPGAPPVKVRSFRLGIPRRVPTFFTLGFPLFWAVVLAAPRSRRLWRVLAEGTGLLAALALLCLLYYTAFTIETTLKLFTSDTANLLWSGAEYLNLNVVPYMAPLLLAMWLHRELRSQVLIWDAPPETAMAAAGPVEQKPRRGRYRTK